MSMICKNQLLVLLAALLTTAAAAQSDPSLSWIVSATTPLLHAKQNNPFAPDRTHQAPYVHWTCHKEKEETTKTKQATQVLQCCQTIYQMIVFEPQKLRWGQKLGGAVKNEKKAILAYCTKNLRPLPDAANQTARFTLLQVPEGFNLNVRIWSQAVSWYDTKRNDWDLHWFYEDIPSPIQLASKAQELLLLLPGAAAPTTTDKSEVDKSETVEVIETVAAPLSFVANLTARFEASDPDIYEERYLRYELDFNVSGTESSADFTILHFFPEGVALAKKSFVSPFTFAGDTCNPEVAKMKFSFRVDLDKMKDTDIGQPDVVPFPIRMTFPQEGKPCTYTFTWSNKIVLEDDEAYLIPAPVIQSGVLDGTTPWDGRGNMSLPVWTNVMDDTMWGYNTAWKRKEEL
jgi:hypothetical protein